VCRTSFNFAFTRPCIASLTVTCESGQISLLLHLRLVPSSSCAEEAFYQSSTRQRQPLRTFMSSSPTPSSPLSTLATSFFNLFETVLATRKDTSFWKTYRTASTKKATDASPDLPCTESRIRAMSDLLFWNACSVSLAASLWDDLLNIFRTAGIIVALATVAS